MADIFREVDEAVQEDRFRRLWRRYGWLLISAAILLVGSVAGYNIWQQYTLSTGQADTDAIASALFLDGDREAAADNLSAALDDLSGDRRALAALIAANLHIEDGNADLAVPLLEAAADEAGGAMAAVATLRLALLQIDDGDSAAIEARVRGLAEQGPWRFTAQEVLALLALRDGDADRARSLYQALAEDEAAPPALRRRAAEIVEELGS